MAERATGTIAVCFPGAVASLCVSLCLRSVLILGASGSLAAQAHHVLCQNIRQADRTTCSGCLLLIIKSHTKTLQQHNPSKRLRSKNLALSLQTAERLVVHHRVLLDIQEQRVLHRHCSRLHCYYYFVQVMQLLCPPPTRRRSSRLSSLLAGLPPHSHSRLSHFSLPSPQHLAVQTQVRCDCRDISSLVKRHSRLTESWRLFITDSFQCPWWSRAETSTADMTNVRQSARQKSAEDSRGFNLTRVTRGVGEQEPLLACWLSRLIFSFSQEVSFPCELRFLLSPSPRAWSLQSACKWGRFLQRRRCGNHLQPLIRCMCFQRAAQILRC